MNTPHPASTPSSNRFNAKVGLCVVLPLLAILTFLVLTRSGTNELDTSPAPPTSQVEHEQPTSNVVQTTVSIDPAPVSQNAGDHDDAKIGLDGLFDQPPTSTTEPPAPEEPNDQAVDPNSISEAVAFTFEVYADGINGQRGLSPRHSFDRLTKQQQDRIGGFDAFHESVSTSRLFGLEVEVKETNGRTALVVGAFTSSQEASHGHDGQTCTIWTIDYTMVREYDGVWRIDAAKNQPGSPLSCRTMCSYDPVLGQNPLGMRSFINIVHDRGHTVFTYEVFPGAGETTTYTNSLTFLHTSLADAREIMRTDSRSFEKLVGYPDPGGLYAEVDAVLSCG